MDSETRTDAPAVVDVAPAAANTERGPDRRRTLVTGVGLGLVLGVGVGFGVGRASSGDVAPIPVAAAAPSARRESVHLAANLAEHSHVRVEPVVEAEVSDSTRLVGNVDFDSARVADVGGRVPGRVTRLLVEHGDHVDEGQALAVIESPELGALVAELLAARADLDAAEAHERRETGLATHRLATGASVERAAAEVASLEAAALGARHRLLAMGVTAGEIRQVEAGRLLAGITLRAPFAGEVVERPAVLGQVVDPTDVVLRVAALDTVWVLLDVYENDLSKVDVGDDAEIVSDAFPNETLRGRVEHVDATIDEETRSARVRVEVQNERRFLRPGQFVHARLSARDETRRRIVVPTAAVLQIAGGPAAFVRTGAEEYELRPLRIGVGLGDRVEVLAGLAPGEELVVDGGFALKSELQR